MINMGLSLKSVFGGVLCAAFASVSPALAEIPTVQHIVIIFQENRTPDNLFHGLNAVLPSADIANSGKNSHGQTITLTRGRLANTFDLSHAHDAFQLMYDNGKMDGGDLNTCKPSQGATCPVNPAFEYVDPADVIPYFYLAVNYGFANRMFQSNQGPSLPAHQFIISGTSQTSATSVYFASDNPGTPPKTNKGCDAPAKTNINLVGPNGSTSSTFPCFEHATLTDLIDNPPAGARQGITWRYYASSEGSLWTGPNAIRHMCVPGANGNCTGPDWSDGKIVLNPAQVLTDISQDNLATVSWVNPTGLESDHASGNDGSGPAWVASVVNAIGNSAYWKNTVILITWDDWGGWYDHVPPPIEAQYGYYENGFRVPLLVVSAYTPAGYVSQQTHTFGSILKFIETAFTLPVVPPGTFADSRSDDLSDFFNFSAPPRNFQNVPSPLSPEFFQHDKRPAVAPDTE